MSVKRRRWTTNDWAVFGITVVLCLVIMVGTCYTVYVIVSGGSQSVERDGDHGIQFEPEEQP